MDMSGDKIGNSHKRGSSLDVGLNINRAGTAFSSSQTIYEPFDTHKRRYKNEGFNPPMSFGGHANLIYATPEKATK